MTNMVLRDSAPRNVSINDVNKTLRILPQKSPFLHFNSVTVPSTQASADFLLRNPKRKNLKPWLAALQIADPIFSFAVPRKRHVWKCV